jgi:NADPH2 dehydrogenase
MSTLFTPLQVGHLTIPQRIAMAPMTRYRADQKHVPLPYVKEYYSQRTVYPGSFVISEAVFISQHSGGMRNVPGIYTKQQTAAWKEITHAVHANQSFIFMQLWALGSAADLDILKEESGISTIAAPSPVPGFPGNGVPSRALEEIEIWGLIRQFSQAAKDAIDAGFDGVEIHGANGYLIDQFIHDSTNQREDGWGGSIEKRARFALEVTKAVANAIGPERTAIRLSPYQKNLRMICGDPVPQFTYLAEKLGELKLAYVHLVRSSSTVEPGTVVYDLDFFLKAYRNATPIILTGSWNGISALDALETKYKDFDIIAGFGRPYISNPDLPFRIREGIPFSYWDRSTMYLPDTPKGYIDYPYHWKFLRIMATPPSK